MASPLVHEKVWFEKSKCEAAERQYYERLAKVAVTALNIKHYDENDVCTKNGLEDRAWSVDKVASTKNLSALPGKDDKSAKKEKRMKNKEKKRESKKELQTPRYLSKDLESKKSDFDCDGTDVKKCIRENASDRGALNGKLIRESIVCENNPEGCPVLNQKPYKSAHKTHTGAVVVDQIGGGLHESHKDGLGPFSTLCVLEGNILNQRKGDEKGSPNSPMKNSLASEVAKARQHIKQSLECMDGIAAMAGGNVDLMNRINSLEKENADLNKIVADLKNLVISLDSRVKSLEGGKPVSTPAPSKDTKNEDDDDGVDLFGSDSEDDDEATKVREARLAAYAEKKSKKPALIAKSNIILSVSPWDDETDMKKMEECVRTIEMDGLVWGASKLVPLAYGIHKLHISCVVEDDKVSIDLLQEKIQEFEDYVQSADIAAFNKV